jgi:hypothetical protein
MLHNAASQSEILEPREQLADHLDSRFLAFR